MEARDEMVMAMGFLGAVERAALAGGEHASTGIVIEALGQVKRAAASSRQKLELAVRRLEEQKG